MHGHLRNIARYPAYAALRNRRGFTPPSEPHFDPESTARFNEEIAKASSYVEYGSGGSTVLASKLRIPTVSVENDRRYAVAVREALGPDSPVDLVVVNTGPVLEWGHPVMTRPKALWRLLWLRYVEAPFSRVDSFPNFILVDGRFRVACALASAREAHDRKQHTILMLDDYDDRPPYHVLERYIGKPDLVGRAAFFELGLRAVSDKIVRRYTGDPA